jgi:hypothetical protein
MASKHSPTVSSPTPSSAQPQASPDNRCPQRLSRHSHSNIPRNRHRWHDGRQTRSPRPFSERKHPRSTTSRLRLYHSAHLGSDPQSLLSHSPRRRRVEVRPSGLAVRLLACSRRQDSRALRSGETRSQHRSHWSASFRHERNCMERELDAR